MLKTNKYETRKKNYKTSEVCPSKMVTSELGISQDCEVEVVATSMGSGPIKEI